MRIYFTSESSKRLKKYYKSLYYSQDILIIDLKSIAIKLDCLNYKNDIFQKYILYDYIEQMILKAVKKRKIKNILIIFDSEISLNSLTNFLNFLESNKIYVHELILIDYSNSVDPSLYFYFTNII